MNCSTGHELIWGLNLLGHFLRVEFQASIYPLVTEYESWLSLLGMRTAISSKHRTDFPLGFAEMASMGFDSTRIIH